MKLLSVGELTLVTGESGQQHSAWTENCILVATEFPGFAASGTPVSSPVSERLLRRGTDGWARHQQMSEPRKRTRRGLLAMVSSHCNHASFRPGRQGRWLAGCLATWLDSRPDINALCCAHLFLELLDWTRLSREVTTSVNTVRRHEACRACLSTNSVGHFFAVHDSSWTCAGGMKPCASAKLSRLQADRSMADGHAHFSKTRTRCRGGADVPFTAWKSRRSSLAKR
ncbi:hypothetical protein P3T76_000813 [Phytophthora citrophthora]|uniref:Uncharacterized protein n=1 Tax=Phytophthora citrophthora TaxID=4793 RepID=A0AAD9H0M3_9STRA|nr:hypothetical protein P3T76_000813 [Phytophthora citrophthora]